MKSIKLYGLGLVLLSMTVLLASCGGTGGSDAPGASAASATITGSVFAAPVAGATVIVLNSSGTTTIAGPVTTANDGTYSVNIPSADLVNNLVILSSSGTFTDEASNTQTSAGTMSAYVEAGTLAAGSKVALDPSSTIVYDLVTKSSKTLGEANNIFATAFGYTPDASILPKNAPTSGSDAAQRLAGLRAMAFSQLTKDLGLTPDQQFDLLAAIANDLADGTLDGKNGSAISLGTGTMPEDIENRFEQSLVSLLTNTAVNLTGIIANQFGALPFAKVALTPTYKVEYLPGSPANAATGKTTFKVTISERIGGAAATGLAVSLMPMMHMTDTKKHATPVDDVIESSTPGTYDCTAYYLMSSGMNKGYWEMRVVIAGESATFYPAVGGGMSSSTTLKGQSEDLIKGMMMGTDNRSYLLYKDGMTTTNSAALFITAAGNKWTTFSSVFSGATLTRSDDTPWALTTVSVEATTNPADDTTWVAGTHVIGGHWTVPINPALASMATGTVYVRLKVDGVQKSTDANIVSTTTSTNGYATIAVKEGM